MKKVRNKLVVTTLAAAVFATGFCIAQPSAYAETNPNLAAVEQYNIFEVIPAGIEAVNEQIPNFTAYRDMSFGSMEIRSGDPCGADAHGSLGFSNVGCLGNPYEDLIYTLGKAEGYITSTRDDYIASDREIPAAYKDKTFGELIAYGKTLPAYTTDAELKAVVDSDQEIYNRGVKSLRTYLPIVDPTLTDLDAKTGDELLALYDTLPVVKDKSYEPLIDAVNFAGSLVIACDYNPANCDSGEATKAYAALISAATLLDADFTVNLSGLTPLPRTAAAPAAPNTGSLGAELPSVAIQVALGVIAGLAGISGAIYTAKRYLFSPLKRRK